MTPGAPGLSPLVPVMDPVMVPFVVWTARALTFFNVLVLLWLGLTVLLTAERRRFGTWLTGGGLLLGGVCSILRASAQAAQPATALGPPELWWRGSWLPFAGAAYLWTVVLTWYAGHLRTRAEWRTVGGLSLLGFWVFLLLIAARPTDDSMRTAVSMLVPGTQDTLTPIAVVSSLLTLSFETGPGDAHLTLAVYLTFVALCIGFGLHALHHPASPDRFMGELASRRARPWLTATSLVTLGLSLIVGIGITGVTDLLSPMVLDLLGALLLAAQAVLLGQAIVTYEVFTGKTLPRRGLARYWRNALILAAGFGGLMALSLGLPLDQSYRLLLALVIVSIFYALQSWRSYVERERSLEQLRPFVASERLVDHLLAREAALQAPLTPQPSLSSEGEREAGAGAMNRAPTRWESAVGARFIAPPASDPFRALVDDLLDARVAFLCPVGPLASLVGAPLVTPASATPPSPEVVAALVARIGEDRQLCLPLDPAKHGGAAWAVPLWGERSSIGLLLLGDRRDGSLYVQEEIEIARAAGERLLDARAAGELARRLLLLQRRRLAEDQILDGRVRRALHDDVLPLLHTALLSLNSRQGGRNGVSGDVRAGSSDGGVDSAAELLADAHRQVSALLASLPPALAPDVARLGLVGALRRVVDDLGGELDGVRWQIGEAAEGAVAELPPLTAEVLFGAAREAIRNAARHAHAGDRSRPLHLEIGARLDETDLTLRVEDDGIGIRSTDARADGEGGSGQGLVLHGTLLAVLGGSLVVDSTSGRGTRVTLRVPTAE